ncbi:2-dehydro-3-deoxygluconate kinase [Gracilibacillus halophilus YIM-C55.5]|uniref:2-dehydro-3-deoxygluconate kinase n=1 Tax=Gracilibacillus halophilus YIM-C55.5 TaxID=1308866 RepID=N4WK21_9BACI|nr:sugar kinase [Gracilibacillus halophilus]ENH96507.1 2-dehydro-3-deoxygluconate kinase [Gracilibacillus halophilus YIM-C55.5]
MKVITFGEMLLRLTTANDQRFYQANKLDVYYGGAEANLAISLANFGFEVDYVSRLPDHFIGEAAIRYLASHQVGTNQILRGGERLGTYYVEAGIGNRSSAVTYDRKFSSFATVDPGVFDWNMIFEGADVFHTTGITLALSSSLRQITKQAMQAAKEKGMTVSFDFNYRSKLWSQKEASQAIQEVLPYVDMAFCNHMDAIYLLGIDEALEQWDGRRKLQYYYQQIQEKFPSIQIFASTKREVVSTSKHYLQGNFYINDELYQTSSFAIEPVIDRIGGGDAYAAGILTGHLNGWRPEKIVSFATSAAVLKHTIKGDGNAFSSFEVEQFQENMGQEIKR